jgi:hypothetical protein
MILANASLSSSMPLCLSLNWMHHKLIICQRRHLRLHPIVRTASFYDDLSPLNEDSDDYEVLDLRNKFVVMKILDLVGLHISVYGCGLAHVEINRFPLKFGTPRPR